MSETQFSPRDDRCAHDFSVSMSLRDGISPTRVRDCGFECGGRLLSITQSSCTPKGVIVNKLPGFVRLNSSLEAWRIQIEHHKLPTVKSRLRLE
jgi:hypothetical protein